LVDRDAQGLERLAAELPQPAGSQHTLRVVDMTDAAQIEALAEHVPPLDALINNAGMSDTSGVALAEQPWAQLDRLLALNLQAPQRLIAACLPRMKAGARVVNVASGAGLQAIPWRGAYSPSKAGLIALTKALAAARPDLVVNVLCPGFVRTELVESLISAGRLDPAEAVSKIPLGRMASPQEMAQVLVFLAGQGAAPLRGQVLAVNGGSSLYGGSRRLVPSALECLPLDLPVRLKVAAGDPFAWSRFDTGLLEGPVYPAVLDASPLDCQEGGLFQAVHLAASRFKAQQQDRASLTLLLPAHDDTLWDLAGDAAAARMLVATLACEWGPLHLRINALEIPEGSVPAELAPLVHFVAGAGAQYLTGQTWRAV
jgi:NAD(P)-dependent dehydrogenase (short-subunit alcohol dehydrogenase family)